MRLEAIGSPPSFLNNYAPRILQDRIALRMATQSEELFFEEMNERAFR